MTHPAEPLTEQEVIDRLQAIRVELVRILDFIDMKPVRRITDQLTGLIGDIAQRGVGTPAEASKDFQ